MGRLDGRVAVITGGASGMGLATVERFVAEGAKVVFCDLPAGEEEADYVGRLDEIKAGVHHKGRAKGGPHDGYAIAERLGSACTFVPADVTDLDELSAVIKTAIAEYGGIDVMYNNAGVGGAEGSVVTCPDDLWDRIIDIDLKAVWRGMKLAAPHMEERGGGSIISTSSVAGILGFPGLGAYGAAKAGVISLTRVASVELASKNIRVNCILPGGIVTPILYDSPVIGFQIDPDVLRGALASSQPLPRAGEASDIANAALWLASDESSFVTGQAIVVDGGLSAEADSRSRAHSGILGRGPS
jgi:NAD(P)-dependent dehydrogenase (short-subunit alcohol dehydrogenase family)